MNQQKGKWVVESVAQFLGSFQSVSQSVKTATHEEVVKMIEINLLVVKKVL